MERLNAWNTYDLATQDDCMDFAKDYMNFLNEGKTERECVDFFVTEAENLILKTGVFYCKKRANLLVRSFLFSKNQFVITGFGVVFNVY